MVLHCPSKEDRDSWLRVFKIILHMSQHNFNHASLNPIDYEAKFMMKNDPAAIAK
jgi:hypothetical protein